MAEKLLPSADNLIMLFNSRAWTSKAFPQRDNQVKRHKRNHMLRFCCHDLCKGFSLFFGERVV